MCNTWEARFCSFQTVITCESPPVLCRIWVTLRFMFNFVVKALFVWWLILFTTFQVMCWRIYVSLCLCALPDVRVGVWWERAADEAVENLTDLLHSVFFWGGGGSSTLEASWNLKQRGNTCHSHEYKEWSDIIEPSVSPGLGLKVPLTGG